MNDLFKNKVKIIMTGETKAKIFVNEVEVKNVTSFKITKNALCPSFVEIVQTIPGDNITIVDSEENYEI